MKKVFSLTFLNSSRESSVYTSPEFPLSVIVMCVFYQCAMGRGGDGFISLVDVW